MTELWSWVLTMFGLTGMWLAGRKVWWTWFVSLAGQVVWFIYALTTTQWGFILGSVAYTVVYVQNAVKWTRERRTKAKTDDGGGAPGDAR